MRRLFYLGIVVTVAAISTGCGAKSNIAPVHGKATLDGKPIADGSIVTLPTPGRARTHQKRRV